MKNYRIFKWFHYSTFIPWFYKAKEEFRIAWQVKFDPNCEYHIDEKSCVNKLFGFCYGFGVHKNSVRFGWTWNEVKSCITLWKYVYENGTLTKVELRDVIPYTWHNLSIKVFQNGSIASVRFFIDGAVVAAHEVTVDSGFYTTLGPYFGGNTRAPHCMTISRT